MNKADLVKPEQKNRLLSLLQYKMAYVHFINADATIEKLPQAECIIIKEVLQHLPMEFAVEAQKLVAISLEGSVG